MMNLKNFLLKILYKYFSKKRGYYQIIMIKDFKYNIDFSGNFTDCLKKLDLNYKSIKSCAEITKFKILKYKYGNVIIFQYMDNLKTYHKIKMIIVKK